jgi:Clp amino terminal domain, pathogenicity island component/ClpX C4-type zinc finger
VFERFTDHARHALVLAQEEARLLNHGFVGTEHLLLGVLHGGDRVAAQALASVGVSLDAVREQLSEIVGVPQEHPRGEVPFTPRAKKVLELSLREARQLGHDQIEPEHLLLGIVREGEGVAARVLMNLGVTLGRVRQQVIKLMVGEHNARLIGPPGVPGRAPLPGRPERIGEVPPWLRCALCGRSLWETAHVIAGANGRACEECIRGAVGALALADPERRELVLPPRVSGQAPDDRAVAAIVTTVESAFGPDAGPSWWATTVKDPERFEPLLRQLRERWGRPEGVRVTQVGFVTEQLAFVRFDVEFDGSRGTTVSGQLRRHGDRWLLTAETLTEVLRRAGVYLPPPTAPT